MDHAAFLERWLDLAEETLPEPEARALRAHLETCASCAGRYERLRAAHAASVAAGAAARGAREPTPVPAALEERILSAARAAAAARGPRRRPWALPGLALGLATAAAAVVMLRLGAARQADAALLREALGQLAPPAAVRGSQDRLSAAAEEAAERWGTGALRQRASRAECPGGEVRVAGLVDANGEPRLVAVRSRERTDVYAYLDDGRPAGSARLASGSRSEFLLPPLPRAEARAMLEAPRCADAGQ